MKLKVRATWIYQVAQRYGWQTVAVGLSDTDCDNIRHRCAPHRSETVDYRFIQEN